MIFVLFIWIGLRQQRNLWKHACYNLGAIFLALFLYELFLTIRSYPPTTTSRDFEYFQSDSLLGYSAVGPEAYEVNAIKSFVDSGDTIYHAQYGFENGYRNTLSVDSSDSYAYFLGGSFVFGEGVNDHETLPSCFARYTDGMKVFNYGFHGYGPHQVLMQLRHLVFPDSLRKNRDGYVYYVFIPPHIGRAHGRTEWDKTGPYFYLEEDALVEGGNFRNKRQKTSHLVKLVQAIVLKSRVYNLHFRTYFDGSTNQMRLIYALIREMKAIVAKNGLEFRVILEYQPANNGIVKNMKSDLDAKGITYYDTHDALINKTMENTSLYIEGDGHPTNEFHQQLAAYLWKKR